MSYIQFMKIVVAGVFKHSRNLLPHLFPSKQKHIYMFFLLNYGILKLLLGRFENYSESQIFH